MVQKACTRRACWELVLFLFESNYAYEKERYQLHDAWWIAVYCRSRMKINYTFYHITRWKQRTGREKSIHCIQIADIFNLQYLTSISTYLEWAKEKILSWAYISDFFFNNSNFPTPHRNWSLNKKCSSVSTHRVWRAFSVTSIKKRKSALLVGVHTFWKCVSCYFISHRPVCFFCR
jgi:hypothetical protein